ncbi:Serine/threonine-protein kinase [Phialemonium atrogriseum]|uniref:EKC/KEOPS complex subunit BUD32 n=1 Tax=Phialemonium atrogriseum TaxID=1093897 RepID=A0AAJ0BTJ4_9PEZI|nr:Serine/threonine-protein kinase [Phialemonium atrogriseum]KAK1764229.1 Serine/threonine-protein kinase [Phialemonium atrogriseum]
MYDDWEGEDIDRYFPGGLHPVALGDFLDADGRFKVVHKLGNGGFATVWLCRDTRENKWRALKILEAELSREDCAEMKFLQLLTEAGALEEAAANHIVLPLEHFYITGPNGRHLAFVLPLMSEPVSGVWSVESIDQDVPLMKDICYQAAEGLAFLHSRGICHGDFRATNVMLRVEGVDDLSEEDMLKVLRQPILYELGELDHPSMPKYLVYMTCFSVKSPHVVPEIGIADFGESFHVSNAPKSCGIPPGFRAPELVFRHGPGFGVDIWALACLISEVRHQIPPNCVSSDVEELVMEWEELIGPLPEPFRSTYIERGYACRGDDDGGPRMPPAEIPLTESLTRTRDHAARLAAGRLEQYGFEDFLEARYRGPVTIWESSKNGGAGGMVDYRIPDDEAIQLVDLFRWVLKYSAEERPTVKEIMQHPWFEGRTRKQGPTETAPDTLKTETVMVDGELANRRWGLNNLRAFASVIFGFFQQHLRW